MFKPCFSYQTPNFIKSIRERLITINKYINTWSYKINDLICYLIEFRYSN